MDELQADEANPFWKRLLEPETAYGVNMNQPIAPMLEKALNTGFNSQSGYTNERALQTFTPAKTSDLNYSQDSGDEEEKKGEQAETHDFQIVASDTTVFQDYTKGYYNI